MVSNNFIITFSNRSVVSHKSYKVTLFKCRNNENSTRYQYMETESLQFFDRVHCICDVS